MKANAENLRQRAQDLTLYFRALLQCPAPAVIPALSRAGLLLPEPVVRQMLALHEAALAAAAAAAAAARAAEAERQRVLRADAAAAGAAAGHCSGLVYAKPMAFQLRTRFWGWGSADISGPGEHTYFRLTRTNPSLFGELFKNAAFTLSSAAGAPLCHLQENFAWLTYSYSISRHNPAGGLPLHMAVVRGRHFFASDVYEVDMPGYSITVGGTWGECQCRRGSKTSLLLPSSSSPPCSFPPFLPPLLLPPRHELWGALLPAAEWAACGQSGEGSVLSH
jgi:hypothetical protein